MSELINVSICLSDIPREKIKAADNGKKYLNICVSERREPDRYDNTHTVFVSQSKEEREARADKVYIGSGKVVVFSPPAGFTPEAVDSLQATAKIDDLPFL